MSKTIMISEKKGFTLIEVLVALSIAVMFMGSLLAIRVRFLDSITDIMHRSRMDKGLKRIQNTCHRDLTSCFYYRTEAEEESQPAFSGTEKSMCFYTLNPSSVNPYGKGRRGLYNVRYSIVNDSGFLLKLMREVISAFPSVNAAEIKTEITEGIYSGKFEYYDGLEWSNKWQKETMPYAVKITVAMSSREKEEDAFSFLFNLPASRAGEVVSDDGKIKEKK